MAALFAAQSVLESIVAGLGGERIMSVVWLIGAVAIFFGAAIVERIKAKEGRL